MKALYTAQAKATSSGRGGSVASEDTRLSLPLSVPKGLGGDDGPGTNPEQLFAAGYSACFAGALGGHFPTLSNDEAQGLLEAAHAICPYSVATRGNVDGTLVVV